MSPPVVTSPQRSPHTAWNRRLVGQVAILLLVNVVVDTVITAPLLVLPEMLDQFGANQSAWVNASAMLAGAMWAPLLGKAADIHGTRRVLVLTLLTAATGAFVCMLAPNLVVFVIGRMIQGAAVAALFLTVAMVRQLCAPRIGMVVTGIVTSGNALVGIVSAFLFAALGDRYGYVVVFIACAALALLAAAMVRCLLPESSTGAGRIDVPGALLLGAGLVMVVAYISVGTEAGWLRSLPLVLAGGAALYAWYVLARRTPEPIIDIGALTRPLILLLLVVVLGAGAYQSMLQLFSLLADITPEQGLGYGFGNSFALGLVHSIPPIGIVLGGVLAGALATRIGPAAPLAGGVASGVLGTLGLFVGASTLPVAVVCAFLLSLTAGTVVTSGFNLVAVLAPPEREGMIASLVMTMIAIGSVLLNFVGAAVLGATRAHVDGESMNSAIGVYTYIGIGTCAFLAAGAAAAALVRSMRTASRAETS